VRVTCPAKLVTVRFLLPTPYVGGTGVASSLTPAPDGAEWSDLRPGRFTSTREPRYPVGEPRRRSGWF